MEIKSIVLPKQGFRIRYSELEANIFEDGKWFCAVSYDTQWCCVGIVLNHLKNIENPDPMLQVNHVYKQYDTNIKYPQDDGCDTPR